MRPKIIILLVAATSACLLLTWIFRSPHIGRSVTNVNGPSVSQSTAAAPRATESSSAPEQETGNLSGSFPQTSPASQSNTSPTAQISASNILTEMQRTVNGPIEFYGRVLDENENQIEGASIELEYMIYPDDSFSTNVQSDRNGMFILKGVTGARLAVQVSKPGYNYAKTSNRLDVFTFTRLPSFDNTRFRPDSNNPVVFHLKSVPRQ